MMMTSLTFLWLVIHIASVVVVLIIVIAARLVVDFIVVVTVWSERNNNKLRIVQWRNTSQSYNIIQFIDQIVLLIQTFQKEMQWETFLTSSTYH
jgi:hypothetical protein